MADRKIEKAPFNSEKRSVLTLAAGTHSLSANESGRLLLVSDAGGTQTILNLPAAAEGLNYTVLVTAAIAHASGLQINTSSNQSLLGISMKHAADMQDGNSDAGGAADDRLVLPQTCGLGSKIELWCDGSSWYAYALTNNADPVYSSAQ